MQLLLLPNHFHSFSFASELMLLGFISLVLAATARMISNICVESKFYAAGFAPCSRSEVEESEERIIVPHDRILLEGSFPRYSFRRMLSGLQKNSCKEACFLV